MADYSRRSFLSASGVCALITGSRPGAVFAQSRGFRPPFEPMLFTRFLRRELFDGAYVLVERSWLIQFLPVDTGYAVNGEQIAVSVTAPESLAGLKKIEEARTENGIFPLQLSHAGLITMSNLASTQEFVDQAIDFAEIRVAELAQSVESQAQAMQFLQNIQLAATEAMSRMPKDIFYPTNLASKETRRLSLPDGKIGIIDAAFEAEMSPDNNVVARATRSINTIIGSDSRRSTESWSLDLYSAI